jgi:hypothetical protein
MKVLARKNQNQLVEWRPTYSAQAAPLRWKYSFPLHANVYINFDVIEHRVLYVHVCAYTCVCSCLTSVLLCVVCLELFFQEYDCQSFWNAISMPHTCVHRLYVRMWRCTCKVFGAAQQYLHTDRYYISIEYIYILYVLLYQYIFSFHSVCYSEYVRVRYKLYTVPPCDLSLPLAWVFTMSLVHISSCLPF